LGIRQGDTTSEEGAGGTHFVSGRKGSLQRLNVEKSGPQEEKRKRRFKKKDRCSVRGLPSERDILRND